MPLFPSDAKDIKIEQGNTGDCFLLASIHSLIQHPVGFEKLKSMFTENPDGSITVRIKRSERSERLEPKKMEGKYDYVHDEQAGEDVFTVKKEKINEIKKSPIGVRTECLPIKIIERISSYYYYNPASLPGEPDFSVLAHNNRDVSKDPTTAFIANILDLYPKDNLTIDQVIQLKKAFPNFPVYLSMNYGKVDPFKTHHDRHAFSLEEVSDSGNNRIIRLVNPWNNTTKEEYSDDTIAKNQGRWCYFAPNLTSYHLANWLIHRSDVLFSSLLEEPIQIEFLEKILNHDPQQGWKLLIKTQELVKNYPSVLSYYTQLQSPQREAYCSYIFAYLNPQLFANNNNQNLKLSFAQNFEHNADFLEIVIAQATAEKQASAINSNIPKNYVRSTLINYYFFQDVKNLTQAGFLRNLFALPSLFPRELILEVCSRREIKLRALSYFFQKVVKNEEIRQSVREPIVLDEHECKEILTMSTTSKNMRSLFEDIYKLSLENPQAALQLAQYALENSEELYQSSQAEVVSRVHLSDGDDQGLRSWFTQLFQPPKHSEEKPILEFNAISKFISSFPFDYMNMQLEQIPLHRDQLIQQLDSAFCKDEQSRHFTMKDFISQERTNENIKKAYNTKIRQIKNTAASRIVHAAIRALNDLSIRLDNCTTLSELEQTAQQISEQINAIVSHPEVINALKVKMNTQDLSLFEKTQKRVRGELNEAKMTQENKLASSLLHDAQSAQQQQLSALENVVKTGYLASYRFIRQTMSDSELLSFAKDRPELGNEIIALELQSLPVNRKLVLEINKYSNPQNPFLGTKILKQVIDNAVLERYKKQNEPLDDAEAYIESILVGYQFNMNIMTRAGGLRDYFDSETPLFARAQLEEITATDACDYHAIRYFFADNPLTGKVYQHVQALPSIKTELIAKILAQVEHGSAVAHFQAMFKLSVYNPRIAQDLAQYALEHAQSLYKLDEVQIAIQINALNNNSLSTWFAQLQRNKAAENRQPVPLISAPNLTQEKNNLSTVLNELNNIVEEGLPENSLPLIILIRENLITLNTILFDVNGEKTSKLIHSNIHLELANAMEQLPKPLSKITEKVLRQMERGIQVAFNVLDKLQEKNPNINDLKKYWRDLLKLCQSPSVARQAFTQQAANLEGLLQPVPDGPVKDAILQIKNNAEQVFDDVENRSDLSRLNSAAEKIDRNFENLSQGPQPSGWSKILSCLGDMINALIAAIRSLRHNRVGFFKPVDGEKVLAGVQEKILTLKDSEDASKNQGECKVS